MSERMTIALQWVIIAACKIVGPQLLALDYLIATHSDRLERARTGRVHRRVMAEIRRRGAGEVKRDVVPGDAGARADPRWRPDDIRQPTMPEAAPGILGDPRMDGQRLIASHEITQAMLDAWPVWSWQRWTSESVCTGDGVAVWSTGWTRASGPLNEATARWMVGWWRPLRLPGMSPDGIVQSADMTSAHFSRCKWEYRRPGLSWVSQDADWWNENDCFAGEEWRPIGWP